MNKRIKAMREGGSLLGEIRAKLKEASQVGTRLEDLDQFAEQLMRETGGKPSFKMVPGYHWSTCISINQVVVHGIPKGQFANGDLVTIDVGLYYKGFHTDAAISFIVGDSKPELETFLLVGKTTLETAINQVKPGNYIWDISKAMESGIESQGYNVVRDLTGHGVGKQLHEEPSIPCFTQGKRENTPQIKVGQTLAVEVMYTKGSAQLETAADGWTMSTRDKSLAGMFEETVLVTEKGVEILTDW